MFGVPGKTGRNALAVAGGIVPDAAIFLLYAVEKLRGTPESEIWSSVYYSAFWQDVVAWGNSIPLWTTFLALGAICSLKFKWHRVGAALMVFAGSCLAHMACDFPVHVEDAHRHLFPVSNWRFRSTVSYWDPQHFGVKFAIFESALGIMLSGWMLMRFGNVWARLGIGFLAAGYLAVPAYFAWQFFGT